MNSLINYLDKYHSQLTVLLLGLSLIIFAVFIWVWFYNRKKYHHLKHQIPASVVKNYLDSIIQNSTALKSSLFRGGGLEVDAQGVPSVMPLSDLAGTTEVNFSGGTGSADDSALRAEVARLQAQLAEKNNVIKDLENQNTELGGEVKAKQERIEELEKLLAQAKENAGKDGASAADPEAVQKLEALQQERDQLAEELKQFEIISDDLADLKRLKQENAQLKQSLEDGGSQQPVEPVAETAPDSSAEKAPDTTDDSTPSAEALAAEMMGEAVEETPVAEAAPVMDEAPADAVAEEQAAGPVEDQTSEAQPEEEAVAQAAAPEASSEAEEEDSDTKSPEDLLSEFEKMLG
ncbi:MAG: hypothetical protein KC478_02285 [Bacteriovoracaceae bacterium]|nr:hypothetical protein [Bacteriovoracaceae bacterium]